MYIKMVIGIFNHVSDVLHLLALTHVSLSIYIYIYMITIAIAI